MLTIHRRTSVGADDTSSHDNRVMRDTFYPLIFSSSTRNHWGLNNEALIGMYIHLSGRIGKVVVSHAEVALIYTMHVALRGTAHEGGGCNQSIGSIVSDAIVRSWLWLAASKIYPLGCFSTLLQVVDN